MVKHVILWELKPEYSAEEKAEIKKGIKAGLFRPITLYPFPKKALAERAKQVKGILTVEMSAGQMVEDVRLATECNVKVEHFGRFGGIIPTPTEVLEALENQIIKG